MTVDQHPPAGPTDTPHEPIIGQETGDLVAGSIARLREATGNAGIAAPSAQVPGEVSPPSAQPTIAHEGQYTPEGEVIIQALGLLEFWPADKIGELGRVTANSILPAGEMAPEAQGLEGANLQRSVELRLSREPGLAAQVIALHTQIEKPAQTVLGADGEALEELRTKGNGVTRVREAMNRVREGRDGLWRAQQAIARQAAVLDGEIHRDARKGKGDLLDRVIAGQGIRDSAAKG